MQTIERVPAVSRAEFQSRYSAKSIPVILTGAISSWPALTKWSLDFFEQRFGERVVGGGSELQPTVLGEGIRKIRDSLQGGPPAPYLHQIPVPKQIPELLEDLRPPLQYVVGNRMTSGLMPRAFRYPDGNLELFISGPKSGFSLLHYDLYHEHAFLAQVHGRKNFRVFSPRDSAHLYPDPTHPHISRVKNAFEPDLEAFPEVRNATPIDFTLAPGEVLFVPAGWWHVTRMSELTISVAWNTLDENNWSAFASDYRRGVGAAGVKGSLKAAYIDVLGPMFRARGM